MDPWLHQKLVGSLPSPLSFPPWSNCAPISINEVLTSIKKISPQSVTRNKPSSREEHIARIAWLVTNKDCKPITVSRSAKWPIKDGNHRLAAAIVSGDKYINVNYLRK